MGVRGRGYGTRTECWRLQGVRLGERFQSIAELGDGTAEYQLAAPIRLLESSKELFPKDVAELASRREDRNRRRAAPNRNQVPWAFLRCNSANRLQIPWLSSTLCTVARQKR
jgi:hypothetical protein